MPGDEWAWQLACFTASKAHQFSCIAILQKGWGVRARGNKADACSRGVNQRAGIGAGTSRGVEEKGLGIEGGQTTCLRIKKGGSGLVWG